MLKQFLKFLFLFIILLMGCIADLHTKKWAMENLKENPTMTIVDGYLEFSYTENSGMVFGLLNDSKSMLQHTLLIGLTIISIIIMGFIIVRLRKLPFFYHLPFFIILSGACANLIDRIRSGNVVDFIHIQFKDMIDWPFLFNVADALICIGGVLLFVIIIFKSDVLEDTLFQRTALMNKNRRY